MNTTQVRIGGAVVLGALLVLGALYLRAEPTTPSASGSIVATAEPLRTPIAQTDEDGNGIPDWEEEVRAFVDAEVAKLPEWSADIGTTTEGTLTDDFARSFFQKYLIANGGDGVPETDRAALISGTLDDFVSQAQAEVHTVSYTQDDIAIGPSTDAALRTYGNAIATAILNNPNESEENELLVFKRVLQDKDDAALKELDQIREAYAGAIHETISIPVPEMFVASHLSLLNAYQAIHDDIDAMTSVYRDPLRAVLLVGRYQSDAQQLVETLHSIHNTLTIQGVAYAKEEPGHMLTSIFEIDTP